MLLNVDFDGVLVPNTHELSLFEKCKREGLGFEDLSSIWNWYEEKVSGNPLPLNHQLLNWLSVQKNNGHVIRLWTNRMYTIARETIHNLDNWKSLFDSFQFHSGHKLQSRVEGVVIDNNSKYLNCGEFGVHFDWR